MDWDNDPELRQLRSEFVDSLKDRLNGLRACTKEISAQVLLPVASTEALESSYFLVHKLAGVATTYQFRVLGKIAENLDDLLSHESAKQLKPKVILHFLNFLQDALSSALESEADPIQFLGDPRMRELTFAVECLPN
jgi:hypothetical protein